jgi:hypothetical protein
VRHDASASVAPVLVSITFASDKALLRHQHDAIEQSPIQLDQICHISSLFETGEEIKYQARIDLDWNEYFDQLVDSFDPATFLAENSEDTISKVSTSQFTCRQLMAQADFDEWLNAEFKQLDRHEEDGMFGEPCPCPYFGIVYRFGVIY